MCASSFPYRYNGVSNVIDVLVNGLVRKGLVDTGCTHTLIDGAIASQKCRYTDETRLTAVNGENILCHEKVVV